MNPSLKFILIFLLSLGISIKASLATSLIVIACALVYLLLHHLNLRQFLLLIGLPLIAAVTIFATLYWFSPVPNHYYAWVLSLRVYVYVFSIACLAKTTTATALARSLEQNLHLPSKFAYGVLAALNIMPQMKAAVKQIRTAGMMRGLYLSFWSPQLYFKAILVALRAADNLAQGMESHGYVEGQKRSSIAKIPLGAKDWLAFVLLLFSFSICLWFLK